MADEIFVKILTEQKGNLQKSRYKREVEFWTPEMEMEYVEILKMMTECARQVMLTHVLEDVIEHLHQQDYDGLPSLLKALSAYASREHAKESARGGEVNSSWEIVSELLKAASNRLEKLHNMKPSDDHLPTEFVIMKMQSDYYRGFLLLNMVSFWIQGLGETRYRFSDILKALRDYTRAEAEKNPDTGVAWKIIVEFLEAAAKESEKKGQELP